MTFDEAVRGAVERFPELKAAMQRIQDPAYRAQVEAAMLAEDRSNGIEHTPDGMRYTGGEQLADDRRKAQRRAKGIPDRLWRWIDAPKVTEAMANTQQFLADKLTFLVLSGGMGVGKTVAAAWLLDQCRDGGRFVKAMDMVTVGIFGKPSQDYWVSLADAPVLVVDDLGAEPRDDRGYFLGALLNCMDKRYDAMRPTVITTNLSKDAFKGAYGTSAGERFVDRIRESGTFVSLGGVSQRSRYRDPMAVGT